MSAESVGAAAARVAAQALAGPAAEWVEIGAVKPWGKNPRKNDEASKRVADSIRRFGFGAPIVARKADGEIIAGHTRYKAAKLLGLKRVPVRYLDVSENDAHLLALADNKLGELAEWDEEAVGELLSASSFSDAMIAGWSGDELGKLADSIIGGQGTDKNPTAQIDEGFSVVIECKDEAEQVRVIEWCQAEELKCRALI